MTHLTPTHRQAELLAYILARVEGGGVPPTIRELCDKFGVSSTNGIADHLTALERKGCIERDAQKARCIYVTELGRRWARSFSKHS